MEWRRRLEEEEQRLRTLVEEATPLLENQDEALRLLDWENMSLETLPTEFSAESDLGQEGTDAADPEAADPEAAALPAAPTAAVRAGAVQEPLRLPHISGAHAVGR